MIKISHESPLALLEDSLLYNDYQYILPYFWDRYPQYKEFMKNYNGFKILDNGLFEGEVPTIQELRNLINEVEPNIFITVDEWNDSMITLKNAKYWMGLKNSGVLPEKTELMVVLQGKSFSEMELLYRQCVDLGYTHFAFNHSSIAYINEINDLVKGRKSLITKLFMNNIIKPNHYIHLLGATDVREFSFYEEYFPSKINSVDTSSPIIKGIEREIYTDDNYHIKSSNKMEVYFDKELDLDQEFCILENIKQFKKIINYGK